MAFDVHGTRVVAAAACSIKSSRVIRRPRAEETRVALRSLIHRGCGVMVENDTVRQCSRSYDFSLGSSPRMYTHGPEKSEKKHVSVVFCQQRLLLASYEWAIAFFGVFLPNLSSQFPPYPCRLVYVRGEASTKNVIGIIHRSWGKQRATQRVALSDRHGIMAYLPLAFTLWLCKRLPTG